MALAATLRKKWDAGGVALGGWATIPSGFAAELMCVDGIDYVCIDQQHGLVDYINMLDMLRAIEGRGVVPITRVPANEPWMIGKALDAGVQGVVVPMVSTREEAAKAVAGCRYFPKGVRSFGPARASMVMNSRDVKVVGDSVLCFVMVETRLGVENVEEIAATPGLDGIYIGPADLALGLGLPPELDKTEPEHVAAVDKILKACQKHNVIPGIQCGSGKAAAKAVEKGFRLVTFTKDSAVLPSVIDKELVAARGDAGAPVKERGYT